MQGKIILPNGNILLPTTRDRATYIGGGDIAAIMGKNKYRNALDVYNAKVNGHVIEDNLDMRAGRWFESFILNEYENSVNAHGVRDVNVYSAICDYKGAQIDWLTRSTDMWVTDAKFKAKSFVDEQRFVFSSPNIVAIYQQVWICDLTGAKYADLPFLYSDNGQTVFKVFRVEANPSLAADMHIAVDNFWHNHVIPQIPPVIELLDDDDIPLVSNGLIKEVDINSLDLIEKAKIIKQKYFDIKKQKEEIELSVRKLIGGNEAISFGGQTIAKFVPVSRNVVDTVKLKNHLGQQYSEFTKPSISRRLDIL